MSEHTRKIKEIDYMVVDEQRIRLTCRIYQHWKQLYLELKSLSTRGCGFPGELSENIVCYCFGFLLNKKSGGDCYDKEKDEIIEVKGTGSDKDDLSSFSPQEHFDRLFFCKVDKNEDCVYIYDTGFNSEKLKTISVNKKDMVEDQQKSKRRPRFSVYKEIILKNNIKPLVKFSVLDKEITYLQ